MPELSKEEKERLEVEDMIKDKIEIQEKLIKEMIGRDMKVVYFNHKNLGMEGRFLGIINVITKEAGIVCNDNYNNFEWYGLFILHTNRLKTLNEIFELSDILESPLVWGYLDKDNKLHTKEGIIQLNFESKYSEGVSYFYHNGKYFIQERENQFQICRECGARLFSEEDMVKTDTGEFYCKSCAESYNIGVCDICGKVHKRRNITLDQESLLSGKQIGDVLNMCYKCVDDLYNNCEHCGRLILKPNIACSDCKFSVILNYSTKPTPKFNKLKNEKTKSYFGWEWEVETKHNPKDIARIANQTGNGLFYCKHDGSIHNGCEIVTHPMTYNFFKKNAKMFQDMFDKIKKVGGHSLDMDNTGVHVHISKEAFDNKDHMINFARCITLPVEYSEFIALRKGNSYAHYRKSSVNEIKKQLDHEDHDRYRAVNFCNSNTIEVRIYKGTINYSAILMYLQHVICCMEYSKTMKLSGKFNQDQLIDYILSKKDKAFSMLKARTKVFKYLNTKCAIKE